MGCGTTREKIEDEMMKLKLIRFEIRMMKEKEQQKLAEILGKPVRRRVVPDYIDAAFAERKKKEEERQEAKENLLKLQSDEEESVFSGGKDGEERNKRKKKGMNERLEERELEKYLVKIMKKKYEREGKKGEEREKDVTDLDLLKGMEIDVV